MSVGAPASVGLPVGHTPEPTWVRDGSAATKKAYALAQGFEEMLVQELSRSLAETSGLGGGGSSAGGEAEAGEGQASPLSTMLSTLLPQALSASLTSAGGLGLAEQMTREMAQPSAPSRVGVDGGSGA